MTAKSQEAYLAWVSQQFAHYSPNIPDAAKLAWETGEAYGRKQALEDVAKGFIKQKSWMQDYAHAVVQHAADEGALK